MLLEDLISIGANMHYYFQKYTNLSSLARVNQRIPHGFRIAIRRFF